MSSIHGMIRILAVDDHALLRKGIAATINWPVELARATQFRTIRNPSGTHEALCSGLNESIGLWQPT